MLSVFDLYRGLSFDALALRLCLAVLCGGIIGLERTFRRRPAGFRTHMLICLGASMTTLTSQFLFLHMNYYTDMARIGAQVVAGIGFIGAGTIIVTRRNQIKGLTTAAGLWTCAIIGLAFGAGFYEGALFATGLILVAELVFSRLEYYILHNSPEIHLYLEYIERDSLDRVLAVCQERGVKVLGMEVTRSAASEKHNACAIFNLRLNKHCSTEELMNALYREEGVVSAEEL